MPDLTTVRLNLWVPRVWVIQLKQQQQQRRLELIQFSSTGVGLERQTPGFTCSRAHTHTVGVSCVEELLMEINTSFASYD